jgi:hypothetical protein
MQSLANLAMNLPAQGRVSDDPAGRNYLTEYDIERRSIYVGSLPIDANTEDLRRLFDIHGTILKVIVHKNESIIDGKFPQTFSPSYQASPLTRHSSNSTTLLRLR